MLPKIAAAILLAALSWSTPALALVVNVDINKNSGTTFSGQGGHADAGNNFWNSSMDGMTNMLASDGTTPTTIDVTLSASSRADAIGGKIPAGQSHSLLVGDYAYSSNSDTTVTLTGLTPYGPYLLYVYCQGDVIAQKASVTFAGITRSTTGLIDGTIQEGANHVVIPVTADASGIVTGTVARNGSNYAAINGLQIAEVLNSPGPWVVNVDLGGTSVGTAGDGSNSTGTAYSGQGAYSDPGNNYWNNTFTSSSRAGKKLIASDGSTVTPVNVSLSASSGYEDIAKTNYLLSDYFHGSCSASITELDPGGNYTLYVYAAGDKTGQGSSIKVNGVTKTTSNTGNPDIFSLGVNYVVFTNVAADSAGRIYIQSTSKLNGFQVIQGSLAPSAWQAEAATLSGVQTVADAAAFGGQAVDGFDATGDFIHYQNAPAANTLKITYANGTTVATRCSILVNNVDVSTAYFAPTGGWSNFRTTTLTGLNIPASASLKLQINADDLTCNNGQKCAIQDQVAFTTTGGQIMVSSILELFGVLGKDNVDVKMTPGAYSLSESDKISGFLPVPILFDFCGSNSSYDFTGVTFNIHTNLYNEYGSNEVRIFEINGHNNHIFGITQKDIGDEPINSTGVLNMAVVGNGNKVEEVSLYTRSSTPYGYGDLFGKGSGAVIGHNKHAALLVNGGNTHLLNCYLELASYGHGIFMQGAIGTLVEGCYVKGVTSNTDVVLAEEGTGSKADLVDFMTVWGWRVQPGYGFSLQEDGIRCYNDGANGLSTANTTVRNCTVDKMRSGVTIGFSDGVNKVYGCTIIGCEGPFWPGNGDTVDHCQSDAPYEAIINPPYQNDSGQTYSITLLDKTEIYGNETLSYLVGSNHNVTMWNSRIQPRADIQTIKMGGPKIGMRYDPVTPTVFTLNNSTLTNWTDQPVRLDASASNCTVNSSGVVTNNGSGNTVSSISPATVTASSGTGVTTTLDANPATYWSASGLGEWIRYDLGTTRNLCEASIQWFGGSSRTYNFDIQTASSPNGPWTTAYSGTSHGTSGFEAYDFPTQLARYIRVVGQGNTLDTTVQIADFDIDLKDRFAMVKAKSEAGAGFICQNTLDGDPNTRWSAQGVGQWIQYDLLETKTIKAVSLAWYQGASRSSNFEIAVSDHPMGPWNTVHSGSSSGTTTQLEEYAFTPVNARFIRVTGLGNSQDDWNNITEIFINTEATIEIVPTIFPLAHWRLDEGSGTNVADSSGNGFHGTLANGTWTTGADGGTGLACNGNNTSVTLPPGALGSISNELSISFWAYGGLSLPKSTSVLRAKDGANKRVLNIHLPYSDGQVFWDAGNSTGYDRINKLATGTEISGRWNHWVFTKNATAGNMEIYLNGILWHNGALKNKPVTGATGISLGSDFGAIGYDGNLDDVQLFDTALTLDQVTAIYQKEAFHYRNWVEDSGLNRYDTSWSGNPDHDSLETLLEYALGGNPLASDGSEIHPGIIEPLGSSTMDYTFRRRTDAVARGLSYVVQTTDDLSDPESWTTNGITVTNVETIDTGFERITVRIALGTRGFLRLHVSMKNP